MLTNEENAVAAWKIEDVIRRYAIGLDERRWQEWDDVFVDDAVIDFTPMGGKRETPSEMRDRLSRGGDRWLFAQHPVTNTVIEFDGDIARAHSEYTMESGRRGDEAGMISRVSGGGSYDDDLVRTESGWRIRHRSVSLKWKHSRVVRDEIAR